MYTSLFSSGFFGLTTQRLGAAELGSFYTVLDVRTQAVRVMVSIAVSQPRYG